MSRACRVINSSPVFIASVLAVDQARERNYKYWNNLNFSACITGVDLGSSCNTNTFPASPANIIQDVNYCCQLQHSFYDIGFCEAGHLETGNNQYNVPVCHSLNSLIRGNHNNIKRYSVHLLFDPVTLLGSPDKYRKVELQCDDNSSLLLFDELDQANMNCMLVELMKLGSDSTKYCLRNVVNFLLKMLIER